MANPSQQIRALGQQIGQIRDEPQVDLNPISAVIHRGCMGLPQELIDHIMDMLSTNLSALKACSLTCKVMLVSTRRLIHQTLYLTPRNNERILTAQEKSRYQGPQYHDVELRFLSYVGERGLLQYTRNVHIRALLVPPTLLPHLHHFQSLDRVHTLTVRHHHTLSWRDHSETCFAHFYPTLTSLTLTRPFGHVQLIARFILLFPNLENVCLEWLVDDKQFQPDSTSPSIDQFPPFCGHLRLAFERGARWPRDLIHEIGKGLKFRSIELESEGVWYSSDHLLIACERTLEDLTVIVTNPSNSTSHIPLYSFSAFRRLTYRIPFQHFLNHNLIRGVLETVTSRVFCEFALELTPSPFPHNKWSLWDRRHWREMDGFLGKRFAKHEGFKFIVRTSNRQHWEDLRKDARVLFPFLANRGCVRFEILRLSGKRQD